MPGVALAMAAALLFPAASPAARGRTAPADPGFVRYLDGARDGVRGRTHGLVPAPISWTGVPTTHFAPLMARFPDRFASARMAAGSAAATSPLATAEPVDGQTGPRPAAYDLRAAGKLSPVRDQGRYGTCWAFASLASLESSLLPGAANDFSENNMAPVGSVASPATAATATWRRRTCSPGGSRTPCFAHPYARRSPPARTRRRRTRRSGTHVHEVPRAPVAQRAHGQRRPQVGGHDLRCRLHLDVLESGRRSATLRRLLLLGVVRPEPRRDARGLGRRLPGVPVRLRRRPGPARSSSATAGVRRSGRAATSGSPTTTPPSRPTTRSSPAPRRRRPASGSTSTTRSAGSPRIARPAPPIRPRHGSPRRTRRQRTAR